MNTVMKAFAVTALLAFPLFRLGAQTDTLRTDTLRTDTLRADTLRADTLRKDTVRTDTLRADTLRRDTLRTDTLSADTLRKNTSVTDAPKSVAKHVDAAVAPPAGQRILWLIDNYPLMRARLGELSGTAPALPIIRSTSSLFWSGNEPDGGIYAILPQMQLVTNSKLPYSRNDGGLWSGKGLSMRLSGGVAFKRGFLRVVIAPEILATENDSFPPRETGIIPSPAIPPNRSSFSFPWYANGPYSLDMPLRFGDKSRSRLRPGQSSIIGDLGPVSFGFSTENEWWGPGIDNALVLSNNAAGFPHLLLSSSHALPSVAGDIEFRWLVGGLTQSRFFDIGARNTGRSISAAVVSLRPRGLENLSVGLTRAVIGTSTGWKEVPLRWLEVLHSTGRPNEGAPYDSTLHPGGRDQLYSVFARWVMPASGVEVYGEWGRLDFPSSVTNLFEQPNRGLAYTLGLQWTRQGFTPTSRFHVRVENTSLEQSLAQRNRFAGVWYTSRRVLQGFTNEGEVLGAAVGPGSSGQGIEMNYLLKRGYFGFEFGRTRYNEDVHQASPMLDYLRWCSHDVALQYGVQGGVSGSLGIVTIRSQFQNRLNAWFQSGHGCPRSDAMVDLRNNNFILTLSPGLRF